MNENEACFCFVVVFPQAAIELTEKPNERRFLKEDKYLKALIEINEQGAEAPSKDVREHTVIFYGHYRLTISFC